MYVCVCERRIMIESFFHFLRNSHSRSPGRDTYFNLFRFFSREFSRANAKCIIPSPQWIWVGHVRCPCTLYRYLLWQESHVRNMWNALLRRNILTYPHIAYIFPRFSELCVWHSVCDMHQSSSSQRTTNGMCYNRNEGEPSWAGISRRLN